MYETFTETRTIWTVQKGRAFLLLLRVWARPGLVAQDTGAIEKNSWGFSFCFRMLTGDRHGPRFVGKGELI